MKWVIYVLVIIVGAVIESYVPADWAYSWGVLIGCIGMATLFWEG